MLESTYAAPTVHGVLLAQSPYVICPANIVQPPSSGTGQEQMEMRLATGAMMDSGRIVNVLQQRFATP
jgi:hypothetical protein